LHDPWRTWSPLVSVLPVQKLMKLELSLAKCQLLILIDFRAYLRRRSSLTLLGFLLETGRRAVLLNVGRVQGEVAAAATTIVVLSAIVVLAVVLTIVLAIVLAIILAVVLAVVLALSTSTKLSVGDTCHEQDREQCSDLHGAGE
jgi:fatty acid desaturase